MEPSTIEVQKKRFSIEVLEERIAPAHLNPGVGVVLLPGAAAHGEGGIDVAMAAPANHSRCHLYLQVH
jgi:hypothetical protein